MIRIPCARPAGKLRGRVQGALVRATCLLLAWCGPVVAQDGLPASEPLRVVVVVGSEVAPNLAQELGSEIVSLLNGVPDVEAMDVERSFELTVARGVVQDAPPDPSCLVAMQLAGVLRLDAALCALVTGTRSGLEFSGVIQGVDGASAPMATIAFGTRAQAADHGASAMLRFLEGRSKPAGRR